MTAAAVQEEPQVQNGRADELLHAIERLSRAIDELPAKLGREIARANKGKRELSESDRQALAVILPKILAESDAGKVFSAANALEWTRHSVTPLTRDQARAVELAIGGDRQSTRRLGRLLERAAGVEVGGAVVQVSKATRDGNLWRCERVSLPKDSRKSHRRA